MARILVADAERNARNILKRALENAGHEVIAVASFEEAIPLIWEDFGEGKSTSFDLVITDIKLSGGSGIELIKKIKDSGLDIPIIVTGGAIPPEAVAEAMKAGANDFLSKPYSEEELITKVNNILNMGKDRFSRLERKAKELLEVGNLPLADKVVRKLFSLSPSSPVPHFLFSKLLRLRGNEELAMKHLECALIMDKNYKPALEEMKRIGEERR